LVLVETTLLTIDDGRPAIDHVAAGLSHGAHVITANKGPAAFAYHDLVTLAQRAGRQFLFEGAVMDGIPIFNLVRETLPCVRIGCFRGNVNSTTNHVLTAMDQGRSFDEALGEMQRAGVAEADPTLDVDGWDAAAKASALANVLLDARMTPHTVERQGIRGVTPDAMRQARSERRRLRLIASAERRQDGVTARVRLESIDERDPLAQLDGMQNALVLSTDLLGDVAISELSGGLGQTAYALSTDLVTVSRAVRADRRPPRPAPPATPPHRSP
jgi:homoserine dehydrogenase